MEKAGQEDNLRIQKQAVLKQSKQIKSSEKKKKDLFLPVHYNQFIQLPDFAS